MALCHQCGTHAPVEARFCARCGALIPADPAATGDPLIGRTIGGSYVLQELVGLGGMGRVYRAEQAMLGRTVAIKVIHPHLLGDSQSVARFYTEARATSRLNHPNSVGIIDFGQTDDGVLFLVMEFLGGRDLARIIEEEGPLPFRRVVEIVSGVLAALSEAHALGVVHRDLKPENIIVKRLRTGSDHVKVVDFGLATVAGPNSTSITLPGLVCGTPDYLSPEQGRGETVDGRADIYAVGVMLFELLSDRLPFIDDTPTKLVLRHINEIPPDPRQIAPHRGIPASLAEIALKALAKDRDARFQDAEEMLLNLKRASESLRPPSTVRGDVVCSSCGATSEAGSRFCRECGQPLVPSSPSLHPTHAPPSRVSGSPFPSAQHAFIGRGVELEALRQERLLAHGSFRWTSLYGDPGVGKTRLVTEFAEQAVQEGDRVIFGKPHPSGAPVPFSMVRNTLARLLEVEDELLVVSAESLGLVKDALFQAGLSEAVDPVGLKGIEYGSRVSAVARVLAKVLQFSAERTLSGRVILVADDVSRYDALSRATLNELPAYLAGTSVHMIEVHDTHRLTFMDHTTQRLELKGLEDNAVEAFVRAGSRSSLWGRPDNPYRDRPVPPLLLEQVEALGASQTDDELLPGRVADAVLQRLERLEVSARRALQAAAVLGLRCPKDWLDSLVGLEDGVGLEILLKERLIYATDKDIGIAHPLVRDLVEASIPAEARRALHDRALQLVGGEGAALEVRVEHACRGSEPMSALFLLERAGSAAMERGNPQDAVGFFQRGLDLARRELLEKGESALDTAIVSFSRRLGQALFAAGEVAGADGVLREALDLVGPVSLDRARMLLLLGKVAQGRERRRESLRLLGQALEIATKLKDIPLQAQAQFAMAQVRRSEGDTSGAVTAYRQSLTLFEEARSSLAERATALLELGEMLMDTGDTRSAAVELEQALTLANEAALPALAARVAGVRAALEEVVGNSDAARQYYGQAARCAAEAGDATSFEQWDKAARAILRTTVAPKPQ